VSVVVNELQIAIYSSVVVVEIKSFTNTVFELAKVETPGLPLEKNTLNFIIFLIKMSVAFLPLSTTRVRKSRSINEVNMFKYKSGIMYIHQ